ncbi:hypothetical protein SAMN02745116_00716 [Pilibacter termitis]|uniref:DUF871 domain-containing protein n=1 Tax=Pilibacter termitis TaxID=263852 RepID=A0A1T4LLZ6_9ENTE|nr:MupG family TIM beta-alpha barrel fold protein [Pilibacter termitis]SJZ55671.1 hypothetical protein SAMN02745116_00716 [Pilibacter termitis]
MRGFSIFLNEEVQEKTERYIADMAESGFTGIFTSLHIPEDDASLYKQRLIALGTLAKRYHLDLMVDISGVALKKAGFSFQSLKTLADIGVTGLRMDYHIDHKTIAQASQEMMISLNASTLDEEDIEVLKKENADFANLEAWHNYYPRVETGLDRKEFIEKNQFLKENNFRVVAFVAGDDHLRGPMYAGLPTLEEHRNCHVLFAMEDLRNCMVDLVYIGDAGLKEDTRRQIQAYYQEKKVVLRAKRCGSAYFDYVVRGHINRKDSARDVLRSAEARFWEIPVIHAEKAIERKVGSITIDNEKYLRYMGEIQVVKHTLASDERVNVVGIVIEKDIPLLPLVKAGMKFEIIEGRDEE